MYKIGTFFVTFIVNRIISGGGPTPFLANPSPKLQMNRHVGMAMPVFGRPKSLMDNGQKQTKSEITTSVLN